MQTQDYYIKKLQDAYEENKIRRIYIDEKERIMMSFTFTENEYIERNFGDIKIYDTELNICYRKYDTNREFGFEFDSLNNNLTKITDVLSSIKYIGLYIKEFSDTWALILNFLNKFRASTKEKVKADILDDILSRIKIEPIK